MAKKYKKLMTVPIVRYRETFQLLFSLNKLNLNDVNIRVETQH